MSPLAAAFSFEQYLLPTHSRIRSHPYGMRLVDINRFLLSLTIHPFFEDANLCACASKNDIIMCDYL